MKYEYKCENCNTTETIEKSIHESSKVEYCNKCKIPLVRLYFAPNIKTSDGIK